MSDDPMAELPEWACALPFDSDEREFVRGFQLGMLWGRIDPSPSVLVYAECAEMLARIRERYPDAFTVADNGPDWMVVTFAAAEP